MRLPSSIPFSVFGGIWLMLVFSQPVSSAPTEVSKRYVPTQSVLDVFQNVTVSVPPVDKRQLDPTQLRRVAFLAQRMNANPKPITDYSTPCNEAICSCATGAAENCVGGGFTTESCDGTGCLIMPRFDNAQGVVAQCISVADATNIFDAIGAPGGPTGRF